MSHSGDWLVIASICDCDRVAVTVMDRWAPGTEAPDPGERTAVGADWRPLVEQLARDLQRETGLPISGQCTVVHAQDPDQRQALASEATELVYAIAEGRA